MVLEELGPTFIKFGQLLGTRPDIIPPEYITELQKLQDEVQPAPFTEIRSTLEAEFGADADRLFRQIHPVPLASASIAQVHRATTVNGEEVVLKVQKRGLHRLVRQDFHVLRLLAEFLVGWPGVRLFDPEGIVRVFERSLQRELNFDYERQNLLRIKADLASDSNVCVPRVFPELSTLRVLTLEYLEGEKLSHLRLHPLELEVGAKLASNIALCLLKQIFEHGVYHADPHPGNFIVMAGGRVGLIDFGNVGRLTPEMADDLFQLLHALIRRNYRDVARWILKHGKPLQETDVSMLSIDVMDAIDPYYGLKLEDIQIGGLFDSLFGMIFRHGITIPSQYVLVGRTFVALEGVVRLCSPSLEVLSVIQPYMVELVKRRWSPEKILRDLRVEASDIFAAIRSYPENLAEALSNAAEGRLRVEAKVPDLSRIERRLDQASSRIQLALLICGLLVSSSILLFKQTGQGSFQDVIGVLGFAAGLLLIGKLVFKS